ncbi:magnesium transporter CorA family protein [Catellatospora sp. NPDC049609]|uniref:magnesium transporter CorA family protein n=1 Tax=Catellatospora sp. NPDC049609 TaxID=3155505 RepID=UPI00341F75BF
MSPTRDTEATSDRRFRTRLYRGGVCVLEDFAPDEIPGHLADPAAVVWLDLCRPTFADFAMLEPEFGLHELAIADCLQGPQRAKLDRYATHLFLNAYAAALDGEGTSLLLSEITVLITERAMITVRRDHGFDMDPVVAGWDAAPELAAQGVAFLLYVLLDHLVDGHLAVIHQLDDGIGDLEKLLFDEHMSQDRTVQRRLFQLRRNLVELRRMVLPMDDVVSTLLHRDLRVVDETMRPYYQNVYDHVMRATEWTESLRDLASTTVESNLIMQANRINLVMKRVTSWAAIIAVPTAITGFYGQNVPYPGFGTRLGVVVSTALIAGLSIALYALFKRKDWL